MASTHISMFDVQQGDSVAINTILHDHESKPLRVGVSLFHHRNGEVIDYITVTLSAAIWQTVIEKLTPKLAAARDAAEQRSIAALVQDAAQAVEEIDADELERHAAR